MIVVARGPSELAFAEWNEEDHPRAADGKFGEGDGGSESSGVPGWTVTQQEGSAAALKRMVAEGVNADVADQIASQLPNIAGRQWTSADGRAWVTFTPDTNVSTEQQQAFVRTLDALHMSNPKAAMTAVTVLPTAATSSLDKISADEFGRTYGSGSIDINANVFTANTAQSIHDQAVSGYFGVTAAHVPAPDYILTHEYGHAIQADNHNQWLHNEGPASDKAVRQAVKDVPPMSDYAQTNVKEAYAEAFTHWRLSDGGKNQQELAKLARLEGWH